MGDPREQRPVTALRGVGAALAARLAVLGVEQVQDLLFVLPTRYEDRTRVQPIGSLLPGSRVVVEGEVLLTEVVFRRRKMGWRAAHVSDASAKSDAVRSVLRSSIPSTAASPMAPVF